MGKVLDLPELSEIDNMKRKDIVSVIRNNYVAPNQATNTRLEIAFSKGRKVESLIKWLERVDKFVDYPTEECNGAKVGGEIGFVETKRTRDGYSMTQKYGKVFGINGESAMVTNGGNLQRVSLKQQEND